MIQMIITLYIILLKITIIILEQSAATISAQYFWAMGLLLDDVYPSELERLDKSCATVGPELTIIKFSGIDSIATQQPHQ